MKYTAFHVAALVFGATTLFLYALCCVWVWGIVRAPQTVITPNSASRNAIERAQEKVKNIFLRQETLPHAFELIDAVGVQTKTIVTVQSVSSPQNARTGAQLVQSMDVKVSIRGGDPTSFRDALYALDRLPVVSEVVSVEHVFRDADNPEQMSVLIRFYIID